MKMIINKQIKYNRVIYPPNTPFFVEDRDVDKLKKIGAWELTEATDEKKRGKVESQEAEAPLSVIEALRKEAKDKGINVNKSWGEKKLREVIAEISE